MKTSLNHKTNNMLDVAIIPHPFAVERVQHKKNAGQSIAGIINELQPDNELALHAHVYLNGEYVPQELWHRVKPKQGTVLTIRMVPMGGGGGGKSPLRTVLSIAVMAGTAAVTGGLSTALGGSTFMGISVGGLASGGVNLLGRLVLGALVPPPKQRFASSKESPTLFIQGAKNQAVPFGRVPKVLGKHRFVPPFGALPYTETVGNEQYMRLLFIWGYGPLEISDLKIGETPISEFEGVELETRQGYDSDAPITLYSNSVLQNDLQVTLTNASGYITRTTETAADEISIDITLPRGLVKFNGHGNKTLTAMQIEAQYAPKGTSDWSAGVDSYKAIAAQNITGITKPAAYVYNGASYEVKRIDRIVLDRASGTVTYIKGAIFREGVDSGSPAVPSIPEGKHALAKIERRSSDADIIPAGRITDERDLSLAGINYEASGDFSVTPDSVADKVLIAAGGLKFLAFSLSAKQSAAMRRSVNFKVPQGQYDVRLRRITADAADDNTFDETLWTALRTIRYAEPVNMQGIALTAMRIKATDQLSGVIDRFNGVVHSVLPDWNGSAWVEQVTSNPASLFRHILQGNANARPLADSRLDLDKIQSWHDACSASGREYNAVIDYNASVREVLHDVASAGRASPSLLEGKWAIIEDKAQSVPVQHFTPRNTFGFKGAKAFDDMPHGLRIRFINREKGWIQDERLVYDEGYDAYSANKYETLELIGVTDPEQAWKDGRYHLAASRLRPESYSFYSDVEHIVCTRGDLIRFTHDVPMFGLMSGRVKALSTSGSDITAVTFDAAMPMEAGKSYAVRFRKSDGSSLVLTVVTNAGEQTTLTLTTPIAISVGPEVGDLALFGESGQESAALVVKAIEPQSDLKAKITCVAYNEGIYTADGSAVPEFVSNVATPVEMQRIPKPVLAQIQSGLEAVIKHTDGSLTSRIVITLNPPSLSKPLITDALIRASGETNFSPAVVMASSANSISITAVEEGETYDIQLRYIATDGAISSPLTISGHRVEGTSALPSDIASLEVSILGDSAYLAWSTISDIDLSHYTLRFTPQTSGATWGSATDLITKISKDTTSITVPAAVGTYLLKAVDIGGRESENAITVSSNIAGMAGYNVAANLAEDSSFAGVLSGVALSGANLILNGVDVVGDWANIDIVGNFDIGNNGVVASGSYDFANSLDLGAVYTSRLTADMHVQGVNVYNLLDAYNDIDGQESWDQSIDPSLFDVKLQLRTTDDDPAGSPTWSSWKNFVVGDYAARAYEFKAVLSSLSSTVSPAVSKLRVNIDMPDRTDAQNNLTADVAGSNISFVSGFKATPAISISAENMASGDYYTITNQSASGFTIQFFNSSSSGVSRTFDYLAKGYGTQT